MMLRLLRIAAVTLTLLARPPAVLAQIPAPEGPAPLQIGPLGLFPTVLINDVGTDSNVFNEEENPKEDFTMTVGPRLAAVLRSGRAQLTAVTSQGFVYFRKYKDEESVNFSHGARLDVTVRGLRPLISAEYTRTRDRPNAEIDARARRTERNVTAGVDLLVTGVTALTVLAKADETRFEEGERFRGVDLSAELTREGRMASGGLKVTLSPFSTLVLAGEFQQDRFPHSPVRDSDSKRFQPTLLFSSEAAISGRAAFGYRWFTPLNPSVPAYRGTVANVVLTYRVHDTTTFEMQAMRDVMYSFEPTEPTYLSTGGGLAVTQRLIGPLSIVGRVQRERHAYRALATSTGAARIDTASSTSGGLRCAVTRSIQLTITGERAERRSPAPGQSYRRTRIFASVALTT
jgi:hypothetical protein